MEKPETRLEAERWVDVAGKLLEARDFLGSKRFARRAQETDPQVEGADQINAIIDVLLASEKRINNHLDWYAILQIDRRSGDLELIKRQYKKFLLLLHPDKNKSAFADNAFKLVCDAWTFLSDPSKKSLYDNEVNLFMKFDPIVLNSQQRQDPPARRSVREKKQTAKAAAAKVAEEDEEEMETVRTAPPPPRKEFSSRKESRPAQPRLSTFWTVCPYCYHLYEYPRVYEDCCLRCQNCRRGFHGAEVPAPPPPVGPGRDSYYCSWAFFPVGYTAPGNLGKKLDWTPFASMFSAPSQSGEANTGKRMPPPRNDSDVGNDSVDTQGGGKKGRTEYANNYEGINMVNMSVQDGSGANNVEPQKTMRTKTTARKSVLSKPKYQIIKEPHNMNFEGNVSNNTVQDGSGANNGGPRKTVIKTTARKSTLPMPHNWTIIEPQNKISGEKSVPEWIGMDLNLEVQAEAEEPRKVGVVDRLEVGSIDNEATEGIGFFEGLDDILGNLPLLSVPGAQKAEMLVEK